MRFARSGGAFQDQPATRFRRELLRGLGRGTEQSFICATRTTFRDQRVECHSFEMPELRICPQLRTCIVNRCLAAARNDYQITAGTVSRCQDPQRIVASVAFRRDFDPSRSRVAANPRDPVSVASPGIFGVDPPKRVLGRILSQIFRLFAHGEFHLLPNASRRRRRKTNFGSRSQRRF